MDPASPAPQTLEDLVALRERGQSVELIDGVVVHKASPSFEHGVTQGGLVDCLGGFRVGGGGGDRGPGGWWIGVEVEVAYSNADVYRHDVVGWRRERMPERPVAMPVSQRPDWVCEVRSPSTARFDLVQKLRTLHRDAVPHYWIVDPDVRTLVVFRYASDAYVTALTAGGDEVVRAEPFDAIEIPLARLFGRE